MALSKLIKGPDGNPISNDEWQKKIQATIESGGMNDPSGNKLTSAAAIKGEYARMLKKNFIDKGQKPNEDLINFLIYGQG